MQGCPASWVPCKGRAGGCLSWHASGIAPISSVLAGWVGRRWDTWRLCNSPCVGVERPLPGASLPWAATGMWLPRETLAKDQLMTPMARTEPKPVVKTAVSLHHPTPQLVGMLPLLAEDSFFLPKSRNATWWSVMLRHWVSWDRGYSNPHLCRELCSAWQSHLQELDTKSSTVPPACAQCPSQPFVLHLKW